MAAAISGAANGVITGGFAAVGIDPQRFNLQSGMKPTLALAGVSALMSSLIGTSAYLKQSPLPPEDLPPDRDSARSREDADGHGDDHSRDDDRRADNRHEDVHSGDRPDRYQQP